jgi:hypothetical protein
MFINNKLDKIISPQSIIDSSDEYVVKTLKEIIGTKEKYRADIASTISTRLVNYLDKFAKENKVEKSIIERIKLVVKSDIFTTDICFNMVKGIYNADQKKYQMMLLDKDLATYVLK